MEHKHIRSSKAYLRIPVITLIIVMLFSCFTFAADQSAASDKGTRVFSHTITRDDIRRYGTYRGQNATRIPVITYHQIVTDRQKKYDKFYRKDAWSVSESTFRQHMYYLRSKHYRTINCDEFYLWYYGKIRLPKRTVLITFDDGNKSAIEKSLPVLKKYNMKATYFIIGRYVHNGGNYRYISEKRMLQLHEKYPNADFQSHTYNLHYLGAINRGYKIFANDARVQNNLYGFNYIAYPYGNKNTSMIKAFSARNTGLRMAFSFGSGNYGYATRKQGRFNIRRFGIKSGTSFREFKSWCP